MEILAQAQESAGEGSESAGRAQESAGERRRAQGERRESAEERRRAQGSAGQRRRTQQESAAGEHRRAQESAAERRRGHTLKRWFWNLQKARPSQGFANFTIRKVFKIILLYETVSKFTLCNMRNIA